MNNEYFILERSGSYPLVFSNICFSNGEEAKLKETLKFFMDSPRQTNPQFADYHSESNPLVSKKFASVLEKFNIQTINIFPAEFTLNGEKRDYFYIHFNKKIKVIDMEESDVYIDELGMAVDIDKLVLDEDVLEQIPLEDRLMFSLSENTTVNLIHKSIVEKLKDAGLTGVRFIPIDEFYC